MLLIAYNINTMEQHLIKLGLTDKEAKVYLAMLELAADTAQNIAKKSGVNRATTYVIIEKLSDLGLVSKIERGKKVYFVAESPTELINVLEEQRKEIDRKKAYLDDAMNMLMAVYNARQDKPAVRYFEGADGLEALDRYGHDKLKPGSQMIGITPIDLIEKYFPVRRGIAVEDRVKRGIKSKILYTRDTGEFSEEENNKQLREAEYLDRSVYPVTESIWVYEGWGVKIFNFNPSNYYGVLIENAEVAENLKIVFELAWDGIKYRKEKSKE